MYFCIFYICKKHSSNKPALTVTTRSLEPTQNTVHRWWCFMVCEEMHRTFEKWESWSTRGQNHRRWRCYLDPGCRWNHSWFKHWPGLDMKQEHERLVCQRKRRRSERYYPLKNETEKFCVFTHLPSYIFLRFVLYFVIVCPMFFLEFRNLKNNFINVRISITDSDRFQMNHRTIWKSLTYKLQISRVVYDRQKSSDTKEMYKIFKIWHNIYIL